jgi:F-type H+-transporting ATPase subunit b
VGPDGGAIGMPQLCTDWFGNQIFWLIVAVGAIYLILSRVALPRIEALLAERTGTITNDIAAAEDLKSKAVAAQAAYEKALADAKAEAQKIAAQTRAEIQTQLDEALEKADAEIAKRTEESQARISEIRATAIQNVEIVARDAAAEIVSTLGRSASEDEIAAAVAAQIKEAA